MVRVAVVLLLLNPLVLLAQETLSQGKVIFEISYKNIPAAMTMQQQMLPRDAVFYFKDSMSRIEMGVANQGKNVTINNHSNGNLLILLNLYRQKFALMKHDSDLAQLNKDFYPDTAKVYIDVKVLSDTKKIAGYDCRKAEITKTINGISRSSECWFTQQIPAFNARGFEDLKKINGFLMEYSTTERGITTTYKARQVFSVPLENKLFEKPDDYKLVTEEELVRLLNYFQMREQEGDY